MSLRLPYDVSGIDRFAAPLGQVHRNGWYLIVVRVPAQIRPWVATLRLSSANVADQTVSLRRPAMHSASSRYSVAYLQGGATRVQIQLHGARLVPAAITLTLQFMPAILAALVCLLASPLDFLSKLRRQEERTWRQRLRGALTGCAAEMERLPANYAYWLTMYDNWSNRRLDPVLAALANGPSVHALVFATNAYAPALAATLASLRTQSYPVATIAVVRPRDALPPVAAPFTLVLQAGEVLAWHALPLLLRSLQGRNGLDGVFADEDCLRADGSRGDPSFKPQPGLMMMCSGLLSRGVWLLRSSALPQGPFVAGWAECLRLQIWFARQETDSSSKFERVPLLLTHRRADAMVAPVAALAAVIDAGLQRRGVQAAVAEGFPLRLRWQADTARSIDIIVPSQLRGSVQISCLLDVIARTTHQRFSMLIVVTQDAPLDAEQMDTVRQIEASGRARVCLLRRSGFNYATANNYAAAQTSGELICLLNDDVSVIDGDWLGLMAARFSASMTGIVGARLYYPDGRTQHGGVIMGLAGLAEHAHKYLPRGQAGYMSRAVLDQEMSAVTGACLMVRRDLFTQLNGLDEALPTAFNDVDFCLRVRALGRDVIMAASVELMHHETISFGHHYAADPSAQLEDARLMRQRWPEVIAADPYHNPNLSLLPHAEWTLAEPPRHDYGAV